MMDGEAQHAGPSVRVGYVECTGDQWPEIAETLRREDGWQPVYWSGAASMADRIGTGFPEAVFHENTRAVKGHGAVATPIASSPALDETLLAELSYVQTIALPMMDRIDPDGSFDHRGRIALYHRHVRNGLALIESLRPDLLVFSAPPHLVYDYVLYQLCRLRRIPVVVFTETAVDGLVFSASSYEEVPLVLGTAYRAAATRGAPAVLSATAERYCQRLSGDYAQAVPEYIVELQKYQPQGRDPAPSEADVVEEARALVAALDAARTEPTGWRGRVRALAKMLPRRFDPDREALELYGRLRQTLLETGRTDPQAMIAALHCTRHLYRAIETEFPLHLRADLPAEPSYLKQYAISAEHSELSYLEYWLYRSLALKKRQAMLESYRRLTHQPDPSVPFVYVPMQYQPEVSTSPLGGIYVEQLLLIELLAKSVPEGWHVYVREHPFQFDRKGSGELTRGLDAYERIAELPNVRLIPLEASPFELIDSARAVATVTGTSGWEAIMRGTPALVFGLAWYRDCEGAFAAADAEACRSALARIAAGYKPDAAKVRLFLQGLEEVGFRGYTIPDLSAGAGVSQEGNVEAFVRDLRRYAPKPTGRRTDARVLEARP